MTEGFEDLPERTRDERGDAGPIARAAPSFPKPDPRLVALVTFACDHISPTVARFERGSEWLEWAAQWKAGRYNPGRCVSVAQTYFAMKDGPMWHTLGQLCWAAKEACYTTPTGAWLVLRYVADAMVAFGIAFPDDGPLLLAVAPEEASPRQVSPPIREDSK